MDKRKSRIIVSWLLAVILTLMTGFVSLADSSLDVNGDSIGAVVANSDPAYAHKFMAYVHNSGYRFSIISEDGKLQSNTVDIVRYFPKELTDGGGSHLPGGWKEYLYYTGWIKKDTKKKVWYSSGIKTQEYNRYTWNDEGVPGANAKMYSFADFEAIPEYKFEGYFAQAFHEIYGENAVLPREFKWIPPITWDETATGLVEAAGGKFLDLMTTTIPAVPEKNISELWYISLLTKMNMPVRDGAGNPSPTSEVEHLFIFTDASDRQKLTQDNPETGTKYTELDIIREKKYKLLIEPVFWYVPELKTADPTVAARYTLNGQPTFHLDYIDGVCYGTASYLLKYAYESFSEKVTDMMSAYNRKYRDHDLDLCTLGPDWGTAGLGITTLMLKQEDEDLGLSKPEFGDGDVNDLPSNVYGHYYMLRLADGYNSYGYSCHIYDRLEPEAVPSTYNSSSKIDEGGSLGVAKFYYDQSNKLVSVDSQDKAADPISIINEVHPDNKTYIIKEWVTGKDKKIPAPSDISKDYDVYKSSNPGSQTGTTPQVVNPSSKEEQSLYIKLQEFVNPTVIKVYEDSSGNTVDVKTIPDVQIQNNVYNNTEPNFKESKVTPNPSKSISSWSDTEGESGTTPNITVPDGTHTIYLHFTDAAPASSTLVLHQNEISHKFQLQNLGLSTLTRKYNSIPSYRCPYTWTEYCGDDDCGGHTRYCRSDLTRVYTDSSYRFTAKNDKTYDINWVPAFVEFDNVLEANANEVGGFTSSLNPNMNFIINRNYADKVTLYPNKNASNVISDLSTLGVNTTPSYKGYGQRYSSKKESDSEISWNNTFTTNFVYVDVDDPDGEYQDDGHGYGHDWPTQSSSDLNGSLESFNAFYSKANNIELRAFLGKTNSSLLTPPTSASTITIASKQFTQQKACKVSNISCSFYPYTKMVYETLNTPNNAYVTSENQSTVGSSNRVETAFYRKNPSVPNLNLTSTQWSTHAKSQNGLASFNISDHESVLPGGALFQLDTANNGQETWLGIEVWQTVIDDVQVPSLSQNSGVLTRTQADSDYNAFVTQVKDTLEHFQIVQWVSTGISKTESDMKDKKLVSGIGSANNFGNNKLQKSEKYYLQVDGSGASRADIDILSDLSEQVVYRIYSDVDGNIVVTKDGVELVRASKSQPASILLSNTEVQRLDDKTKLVENFVSALDRNLGSTRDSQTWYNEAFDGMTIINRRWAIQLGFDGSASDKLRSVALDTRLTGLLENRSDLYNFDASTISEKARTSLFKTSAKSSSGQASSKPNGFIGSLNGMDIQINGVEDMFKSKLFYIPNATVNDLN